MNVSVGGSKRRILNQQTALRIKHTHLQVVGEDFFKRPFLLEAFDS